VWLQVQVKVKVARDGGGGTSRAAGDSLDERRRDSRSRSNGVEKK